MGQTISKKIVPRLNNALKSYEEAAARDALDQARRSQAANGGYSDPNATLSGFKRDKAPGLRKEVEQEAFLKTSQGAAPQEMPEDLIRFLQDVGPLEKRVEKSMTSPKVYDSLKKEEDGQKQREAESKRTRRTMPLTEGLAGGLDGSDTAIQGAVGVERTTNFSTADLEEDAAELKLTDREMAELLRKYGATDGRSASSSDGTFNRDAVDTADAEAYIQQHFSPDQPGLTDDRHYSHISLLSNLFAFTGMPVLMKDVDSDFVGTWKDRVADMKRMKLRIVTEAEATLLFEGDVTANAEGGNSDTGGIQDNVGSVEIEETETHLAMAVSSMTQASASQEASRDGQKNRKKKIEEGAPESRKGKIGSSGPSSAAFLEQELHLRPKD